MVSMDDVAIKAKVSKATVSRVLNGKNVVSKQVKEKVLEACERLNYRMNSNIQDLVLKSRNGATRNIAFVTVGKDFSDPAYASLIDGVASAINEFHYHLMLVKLSGQENNIYDLPQVLRDDRVDGILLTGALSISAVELMKKLNIECVILGNYDHNLLHDLSSVQSRIEYNIFNLIDQLYEKGCKKIAYVEENLAIYSAQVLFDGFKTALQSKNLNFDPNLCYFGNGPFSGIINVMLPIFTQAELPFDGIICPDLRIAREISHLLFGRYGLNAKIPVILGTMRRSDYYKLPVPSVYADTNNAKLVHSALEQLVAQIEGKSDTKIIYI